MSRLSCTKWWKVVFAGCLAVSTASAAPPPRVTLGVWHTTGPLKAQAFGDALFPEKGVDLSAKSPAGQPLWTPRPQWSDGQVQGLPAGDRMATYLFRTLTTEKAGRASAGLGSHDGLEVWLNGKKLLSHDRAGGVVPNSDSVVLDLKQGENQLLLKIYNQSGSSGFYFELGTTQTRIARLGATEFPALRGMTSTREAIEDLIATYGGK
jgi:hypothetical protein